MVKVPPGFESSPRLGRVLPKCHVGPGSRREEPAPGATRGALARAPAVGRRGAAAGAAAGPERPAPGWLWLKAAGPGENPGQRPKRQGGGKARCPRTSPATCSQITWWRSSRWRMSPGTTTGTSSKVRARSPEGWGWESGVVVAGVESARKFFRLEVWVAAAGGFSRSPGNGPAHPDRREQTRAAHGPADAQHRLMLGALRKRLRGMSGSIPLVDL